MRVKLAQNENPELDNLFSPGKEIFRFFTLLYMDVHEEKCETKKLKIINPLRSIDVNSSMPQLQAF